MGLNLLWAAPDWKPGPYKLVPADQRPHELALERAALALERTVRDGRRDGYGLDEDWAARILALAADCRREAVRLTARRLETTT